MTSTDHVLDAIDHALEDWAVSEDAMRWAPEPQRPVIKAVGGSVWFAPIDTPLPVPAGPWQTLGWVDETHVFEAADLQPFMEAIQHDIHQVAVTFGVSHLIVTPDGIDGPTDAHRRFIEGWPDD